MENNLNEQQQELLSLIEVKAFDELTKHERNLVLNQMSQAEYELERSIIVESVNVFADVEPLPLQIEKKRGLVIPMYQAIAGIAAAIIISFFIFRSETIIVQSGDETILAQSDTVYINKVIVDTVTKYRTRYIEQASQSSNSTDANFAKSNREPVVSFSAPQLPELLSADLTNTGIAGINSETTDLVNDFFDSKIYLSKDD